jgi:uncharacterized RDD family membrane protein YckC
MNRYHNSGARLGAAFIDGFVFFPIAFGIDEAFGNNSLLGSIILSVLSISYTVYLHGRYGKTIGKRTMRIKVVQLNDESKVIGFEKAFLRESVLVGLLLLDILYALFFNSSAEYESFSVLISSGWLLAELVTMLFNKKRRAIHDLIAGSVVINTARYIEWKKKLLPQD